MKAIIITILLFLTVNLPDGEAGAQTNLYVSTTSAGNGSGDSWANAKSFSSLRGAWNTIPAGTTVYINGGSAGDSVFYSVNGTTGVNGYAFNPQGTVAEPIIVTKGVEAGHNGKVIFRKNTTTGGIIGLNVSGASNTIIQNIEFQGKVTTISQTYSPFFYTGTTTNLTFQYCTWRMFYGEGVGTNGSSESSDNIKFLHCDFLNLIDTGTNSAMDMMWLGGANHKNWEIAYCNFINDNPKTGATVASAHRDLIQCEAGWGQGGTFKIHHNFFDDRSAGAAGACIESEHLRGTWEIYNNVFISNSTGANNTGFFSLLSLTGEGNTYANSMKVYNNTFYAKTNEVRMMSFNGWDALDFRNNIVYSVPSGWWCVTTDGWTQTHSMTFDYNQYNNTGSIFMYGESVIGSGQQSYTWTQWRNAGYDAHSTYNFDTPDFVDPNGTDGSDYALQNGSDGIDDGTTITLTTPDFLNVDRPQGNAYDLGAFEYDNGSSNNINVKAKIFLQGPFNTNAMLTTLNQNSLLPNSQPYNIAPWNYGGVENLGPGPNSTMVDWVLVELRSATNPEQVVARRAAILKNDGRLLETNGVEGVNFNNVQPGSYYIAVYHRTHLAIMSAVPVPLSSNSDLYDFTTAMNKAYGQNPMVELAPGKYGMYAGDGNADGVVNITDRDDVWLVQNGTIGYLGGDYNMNSGVTIHDVNQLWNLNNGKTVQVPQ